MREDGRYRVVYVVKNCIQRDQSLSSDLEWAGGSKNHPIITVKM